MDYSRNKWCQTRFILGCFIYSANLIEFTPRAKFTHITWVYIHGCNFLFWKIKKKKKKHSPLNSSIVLNHGKLCLDLCNKQVGNKCVSKFPHRIRMIRERVIGGSTLSLVWSLDHPSLKKKKLLYIILKFLWFFILKKYLWTH